MPPKAQPRPQPASSIRWLFKRRQTQQLAELSALTATEPSGAHPRRIAAAFNRIIIETTGLTDPAPVAQTFFIDDDITAYYALDALDALVTVVDALHAPAKLDEFHEAQEQVAFADRLLISKSDLVGAAEGERLRQPLARMNPRARITTVNFGATPVQDPLDIAGYFLDGILDIEPGFLDKDHHEHDDAVESFVFASAAPFNPDRLQDFFCTTFAAHAKDLMR